MVQGNTHRGHHIIEHYLGDGISRFVVIEHSDGLVSGRGSHAGPISAQVAIDVCCDGEGFIGCGLQERANLEPLAEDEQATIGEPFFGVMEHVNG